MKLTNRHIFFFVFAVVNVLFAVIYVILPMYADDMWYLNGTYRITDTFEITRIVAQNCADHWIFDTGRLANLMAPLWLGLLPRWVFAIFCAAMTWITFHFVLKIVDSSYGSLTSWALLFAYTFLLPWSDHLTVVIYSLNYLWTGAFAIAAFWLFISNCSKEQPYTQWQQVLVTFVCIAAGWMHEGFSVPLLCGFFVYAAVGYKLKVNSAARTIALLVLLGLVINFISPSLYVKTKNVHDYNLMKFLYQMVRYNQLTVALVATIAVGFAVKRLRSRLYANPQTIAVALAMATVAIAGIAIYARLPHGPRMFWLPQLAAFIGLAVALKSTVRLSLRAMHNIKIVAASAITVLCVADLANNIKWQIILTDEYNNVMQLYEQTDGNIVYYNLKPLPNNILFIDKTSFAQFHHMTPDLIPGYYGRQTHPKESLQILPQ